MAKLVSRQLARRNYAGRLAVLLGFLLLVLGLMIARLLYLQVYLGDFLADKSMDRALRVQSKQALRGMILDREGEPLAISSLVASVVADPKVLWATLDGDFERLEADCLKSNSHNAWCDWVTDKLVDEQTRKIRYRTERLAPLAERLKISGVKLYSILLERADKRFYPLKRQLPPDVVDEVMALEIGGISREDGYQRFYPAMEAVGQIVGFTDLEEKGQEGIELAYEDWLAGQAGRERVLQNKSGKVLKILDEEMPASAGVDLQLSIDKRLQVIMYQVLLETMENFAAKSVYGVMIDVRTGEVLAMLSLPAGNPNNRAERVPELMKNRAITDVFETGSVIKPIAVAAALEEGVITPSTVFRTGAPLPLVGGVVRDDHVYASLDTAGVIRKSSNVGMGLISKRMSRKQYESFLRKMGFGRTSAIGFPGEQKGVLNSMQSLNDYDFATTTFGYGFSVTALQMAHAYATIANNGVKLPLSIVKQRVNPVGERVMSEKTAREVKKMLLGVTQADGTGRRAAAPSYTVAGKTGTAIKTRNGVYVRGLYRGFFAGFAPVSEPRIAMMIVVDEPSGDQYYGGLVAAPAFSQIAESSLKLLGVLPDKIERNEAVSLSVDESVFADALPDGGK